MAIRVLLASGSPWLCRGLREGLTGEHSLELVGEAGSAEQTLSLCQQMAPDILVLDLAMASPPVSAALDRLNERCPDVRAIVLADRDQTSDVDGLLAVGVRGYVLKEERAEALLRAIRAVAAGDTWVSADVIRHLANPEADAATIPAGARLTRRELEVLHLVVLGRTDPEIAADLRIARRTVRDHLRGIFDKLAVANRVEAAVRAERLKLFG